MYYNYVINNSRRTITIREYDDFGDRVATYRTYPFSISEWNNVRDNIKDFDKTQLILNSLVHGNNCRKIR